MGNFAPKLEEYQTRMEPFQANGSQLQFPSSTYQQYGSQQMGQSMNGNQLGQQMGQSINGNQQVGHVGRNAWSGNQQIGANQGYNK